MISHRNWIFKLLFSVVESKLKRHMVKKIRFKKLVVRKMCQNMKKVRAQKRAPEGRGSQNPPAEKWPKNGWDIALVGGWGELRPPGSEWGETLRAFRRVK